MSNARRVTIYLTPEEYEALNRAVTYWTNDAADFIRHGMGYEQLPIHYAEACIAWQAIRLAYETENER